MSNPTQHYIRTIHTSFTATSSAWAASSTSHSNHWPSHTPSTYTPHHHHHYPSITSPTINSNHDLQKGAAGLSLGLSGGLGLGDWRSASGSPYTSARSKRAASRLYQQHSAPRPVPPHLSSRVTPASIKYQQTSFDPFYDEPLLLSTSMATTPPLASPVSSSMSSPPSSRTITTTSVSYASPRSQFGSTSSRVHTISIPPAPTPTAPSPSAEPSPLPSPHPSPSATSATRQQSIVIAFPLIPQEKIRGSLVAGILLNRVHAVGKPMKRRPGHDLLTKGYIKSNLSSVVSCEA